VHCPRPLIVLRLWRIRERAICNGHTMERLQDVRNLHESLNLENSQNSTRICSFSAMAASKLSLVSTSTFSSSSIASPANAHNGNRHKAKAHNTERLYIMRVYVFDLAPMDSALQLGVLSAKLCLPSTNATLHK